MKSSIRPHAAEPKVSAVNSGACLYIEPIALYKMQAYIDNCEKEIAWLGQVDKLDGGDYLCSDVYLLHQDVASTTAELQPSDLVVFAEEVGDMSNIRMWGHSHVNMGTSPSGQDKDQMNLFRDNGYDWYIRVIGNKKGRLEVTLFDWKMGILISDMQWDIYYHVIVPPIETIQAEIKEKVRDKVYSYTRDFRSYENTRYVAGSGNDDWSYDRLLQRWVQGEEVKEREAPGEAEETLEATMAMYMEQLESCCDALPYWIQKRMEEGVDMESSPQVRAALLGFPQLSYDDLEDYLMNGMLV